MANYAVWNVRLRHVWLQTPSKAARQKRRARLRSGLQDAIDRRTPAAETPAADGTTEG
jgi:hypothetical protein